MASRQVKPRNLYDALQEHRKIDCVNIPEILRKGSKLLFCYDGNRCSLLLHV